MVGIGTYQVTVTDANGCSATDEVIVKSGGNISVNAGADVTTCSPSTTLTATVTGGVAPFAYKWSNAATTPSVSVGIGTYQVTVTDANGCTATDEVIVKSGGNIAVNAGADVTTCAPSTTLNATVTSGVAPFAYKWSNAATTSSISVGIGTYQVTVTDANGCAATDEVIVKSGGNIAVNAGADITTCAPTATITPTVTGGIAPFSYTWSNGKTTPSVSLGIGTYQVTVTDANGCSASDEIVVTTGSSNLKASIRSGNNGCNGGKDGRIFITVLSGTLPYSYSIDNGTTWSANANYYNLFSGEYKVIVREAGGCTYAETVIISEPTPITFTPTVIGSSIKIENTTGGNGAPYQYSINYGADAQSSNTFNNLAAGTYFVRVKDAALCFSTTIKPVVVSIVPKSITFTVKTTTGACGEGETITISDVTGGVAPYQYSLNGGTTWQPSQIGRAHV